MVKKVISILIAGIILVTGFASCNKNGTHQKDFAPSLDVEKEVSLTVLGSYGNFEALEQVINDFNKFYPNVNVTYEFTNTVLGSAKNRVVSKENIDILFMESIEIDYFYGDFAKKYLVDLVEEGIDVSNIDPRIFSTLAIDGKHYFMPAYLMTNGLLVNTSFLAKYNIPIPTNMNELIDACEKLHSKGITPIYTTNTFAAWLFFNHIIFDLLKSENKDSLIADMNNGKISAEIYEPSIKIYKQWLYKGYFDFSGNTLENSYGAYIMRFLEGDIPFLAATSDTISGVRKREAKSDTFQEKPFKYTYIPAPTGDTGYECAVLPNLLFSVCNVSNNLEYAVEFIKFMYTEKELNVLTTVKGMPSAYRKTGDPRLTKVEGLKEEEIFYLGEEGLSRSAINALYYSIPKIKPNDENIVLAIETYEKQLKDRLGESK